jgi:hypothetical protein
MTTKMGLAAAMAAAALLTAPTAHADDDAFQNELRNSPRGQTVGPAAPMLNTWIETMICHTNLEGATDEAILRKMQSDMFESYGIRLTITDAAIAYERGTCSSLRMEEIARRQKRPVTLVARPDSSSQGRELGGFFNHFLSRRS